MKFTKIPIDAFEKLQMNAGILLRNFDPATGEYEESDMIGATTGGLSFAAIPTFRDNFEDVDNAPKNTKEGKELDYWDVNATGTLITVDTATAKDLVAAADIGSTDTTKVTPRDHLKDDDFADLWLVADYSKQNSEESGGYIAIHMMNALATGGFSMKTSDRAKGQFAFTYTAHTSIREQGVVPFELYIKAGTSVA